MQGVNNTRDNFNIYLGINGSTEQVILNEVQDVDYNEDTTTLYDKSSNLIGYFQTELVEMMYLSIMSSLKGKYAQPGRYYNVHTKSDIITLGPVGDVERTDSVIILRNKASSLIGLFPKKDVLAMYLVHTEPEITKEIPIKTPTSNTGKNKEHVKSKRHTRTTPAGNSVKANPVIRRQNQGLSYATRINPHTKSYEVGQVQSHDANLVDTGVLGTELDNELDNIVDNRLKYVGLTHGNQTIKAILDTKTGKVLVEKGMTITRRTARLLKTSQAHKELYSRRLDVIRQYADFHNAEFFTLKEDVGFNSLREASIVLTGTSFKGDSVWYDLEGEVDTAAYNNAYNR